MFILENLNNLIGVFLATLLALVYLYYYCFRDGAAQTEIERARYGKNRKSVEHAVEEQRHKAALIADYKKELDRTLEQVRFSAQYFEVSSVLRSQRNLGNLVSFVSNHNSSPAWRFAVQDTSFRRHEIWLGRTLENGLESHGICVGPFEKNAKVVCK